MKRNWILAAVLGVFYVTGAVAAFAMPPGGGPFGLEKLAAFSKLPADKQALVISTFESVKQENKGLRNNKGDSRQDERDTDGGDLRRRGV